MFADMCVRVCTFSLVMWVLLLLPSQIESVAVMSVDLGSEWMKIAIVSVIFVSACNIAQYCNYESIYCKRVECAPSLPLPSEVELI
jgi:hypothetical protein